MSDREPSGLALVSSLIVLALVVGSSLAGLFAADALYPNRALHLAFVPVDGLNLVFVAPLMGALLHYTRKGVVAARLIWPGLLAVILYTYVPYLVAVPVGPHFLAHLAIVVLSAYTLVAAGAGLDVEAIATRVRGRIPARTVGGLLVLMGVGFLVRNVVVILGVTDSPDPIDVGVWIADGLLFPAFIGAGLLLIGRRPSGLFATTPVLFVASTLFIELVPVLAYPAVYDGEPIPWFDVAFVLAFGLVCFVPLGLCLRALRGTVQS